MSLSPFSSSLGDVKKKQISCGTMTKSPISNWIDDHMKLLTQQPVKVVIRGMQGITNMVGQGHTDAYKQIKN